MIFPVLVCFLFVAQAQDKTAGTPQSFWYQYNMPWIATVVISMATICINLLIAKRGFRQSKENMLLQMQGNISGNNRQKWIDEVRANVSELCTQSKMLNIEFHEPVIDKEKKKAIHEKVTFTKNKLLLLLDPQKPLHMEVIKAMDEFLNVLDQHMFHSDAANKQFLNNADLMNRNNEMINNTRALLYSEWNRIQQIATASESL